MHKVDAVILKKDITKAVEDAIPRENGSTGFMLTSKVPLQNELNEIVGIVGISFDIADRKTWKKCLVVTQIGCYSFIKALQIHSD